MGKALLELTNERCTLIIQNITMEQTVTIVSEILKRARDDYIYDYDNQRSDAEVFLRGNWAQILTNGALEVEAVFKELDRCKDEFGKP